MSHSTEPPAEPQKKTYTIRSQRFLGRNVHELTQDELKQMVEDVYKGDPDSAAGIRLMRHILDKHGPEQLIKFVEWGQHIIDVTGKITRADFTPDPGEPPLFEDEEDMLQSARPRMMNRRTWMLGIPSALITAYSATRLGLQALENATTKEEPAHDANDNDKPHNRLASLNRKLDTFSSPLIEILGSMTLLYEVLDIISDYEDEKFDQISNAVAELADNMGIGAPTPTFRLDDRKKSTSPSNTR
jgi:hypothetical protein